MSKRSIRMAKKTTEELKKIAKSGSLSAAAAQYHLNQRGL